MAQLIGLLNEKPPAGWIPLCIKALIRDNQQQYVLLLDDFMSQGFNVDDRSLLFSIKSHIRSSNITVIVFTQNKEAANSMLQMNDLEGIQPLQDSLLPIKIKARGEPYALNWETEMNMKWATQAVKEAMRQNPQYRCIDVLDRCIDNFLEGSTDNQRTKGVTPLAIGRMLRTADTAPLRLDDDGSAVVELLPSPRTPRLTFCGAAFFLEIES
jgi:hypothetical protein